MSKTTKTQKATSSKTSSKKASPKGAKKAGKKGPPAKAKTAKKSKAPKKQKVMTVKEIGALCADQLQDQHKLYQKYMGQLGEMEDDAKISVSKVMKMLNDVVMSDRDAKDIIDGFLACAASEIEEKGEFTFPGLVKVFARYRKALPKRDGRNPATGDTIKLPARKASWKAAARPMKAAKDAIETFSKKNPAK